MFADERAVFDFKILQNYVIFPAIGFNGVMVVTVGDNAFNCKKFKHLLKHDLASYICNPVSTPSWCKPPFGITTMLILA
ncbi:hypothetical protein VP01_4015g4 [Puccinia sorghi]|uniref:Uncharacterized protein n=1 Tax=Puccinia sorghi TaxID=27349 RepID=A0A0L6UTS0_9BASI|nr:hypothetical protein VP01_4015g4 [Puccinia sorghi]